MGNRPSSRDPIPPTTANREPSRNGFRRKVKVWKKGAEDMDGSGDGDGETRAASITTAAGSPRHRFSVTAVRSMIKRKVIGQHTVPASSQSNNNRMNHHVNKNENNNINSSNSNINVSTDRQGFLPLFSTAGSSMSINTSDSSPDNHTLRSSTDTQRFSASIINNFNSEGSNHRAPDEEDESVLDQVLTPRNRKGARLPRGHLRLNHAHHTASEPMSEGSRIASPSTSRISSNGGTRPMIMPSQFRFGGGAEQQDDDRENNGDRPPHVKHLSLIGIRESSGGMQSSNEGKSNSWYRSSQDGEPSTPSSEMSFDYRFERQRKAEKLEKERKRCSQITEFMFVSGDVVARDKALLKSCGITHVLNAAHTICGNYHERTTTPTSSSSPHTELSSNITTNERQSKKSYETSDEGFTYLSFNLMDSTHQNLMSFFLESIVFIEEARTSGGACFIHCQEGVSRSCAIAIAYLMWRDHITYLHAFDFVRKRRSVCSPNQGFVFQLHGWGVRLTASSKNPTLLRIAPHSPSDQYLIYKPCLDSRFRAAPIAVTTLDQRGAFLLHVPDKHVLFVWVGPLCQNPRAFRNAALRNARWMTHVEPPMADTRVCCVNDYEIMNSTAPVDVDVDGDTHGATSDDADVDVVASPLHVVDPVDVQLFWSTLGGIASQVPASVEEYDGDYNDRQQGMSGEDLPRRKWRRHSHDDNDEENGALSALRVQSVQNSSASMIIPNKTYKRLVNLQSVFEPLRDNEMISTRSARTVSPRTSSTPPPTPSATKTAAPTRSASATARVSSTIIPTIRTIAAAAIPTTKSVSEMKIKRCRGHNEKATIYAKMPDSSTDTEEDEEDDDDDESITMEVRLFASTDNGSSFERLTQYDKFDLDPTSVAVLLVRNLGTSSPSPPAPPLYNSLEDPKHEGGDAGVGVSTMVGDNNSYLCNRAFVWVGSQVNSQLNRESVVAKAREWVVDVAGKVPLSQQTQDEEDEQFWNCFCQGL